jgi:hypothetical protein
LRTGPESVVGSGSMLGCSFGEFFDLKSPTAVGEESAGLSCNRVGPSLAPALGGEGSSVGPVFTQRKSASQPDTDLQFPVTVAVPLSFLFAHLPQKICRMLTFTERRRYFQSSLVQSHTGSENRYVISCKLTPFDCLNLASRCHERACLISMSTHFLWLKSFPLDK